MAVLKNTIPAILPYTSQDIQIFSNKRQNYGSEVDTRIPIGQDTYDYIAIKNNNDNHHNDITVTDILDDNIDNNIIDNKNLIQLLDISSIMDKICIIPGFYSNFGIE
jgi:hypothetical protein